MKSHENKYLLRAYTSPFNSVCAKYVDSIWELGMSYQDSIMIQFQTNRDLTDTGRRTGFDVIDTGNTADGLFDGGSQETTHRFRACANVVGRDVGVEVAFVNINAFLLSAFTRGEAEVP